ncbi:neprilysin-3-like isoform X2 [Ornithodoros turicata]|uniref:neprilysin-3-like isoform X2 n=1 Tax=Ornithodoros turicata TaxID=34597 RepID=UPI00313A143B
MASAEAVQETSVDQVPEAENEAQLPGIPVVVGWMCAILFGLTTGTILVTSLAVFTEANDVDADAPDDGPRREFLSCTTQSCASAAEALTMTLSFDVDPCHDLFGFVCRRYQADFFGIFKGLHNHVVTQAMAVLFKTPDPAGHQATAIHKAAILLRSCMRLFVGAPAGQTTTTANAVLQGIMTEFKLDLVLKQSSTQDEPCETIMNLGLKYNIEILASLTTGNNLEWRSRSTIKISRSVEDVNWYERIGKDAASVAKMYEGSFASFTGKTGYGVEEFKTNVLNLEQNIAQIVAKIPLKGDDDLSYELKPLASLHSKFRGPILRNGQGFFSTRSSVFVDPQFMRFVDELDNLSKQEANFAIAYTLLRKYGVFSSSEIMKVASPQPLARDFCVAHVTDVMPVAFSAAFLFKLITNTTIQVATNIALRVKDSFIAAVSKTKSFDHASIMAAIAKLKTMELYVAFPKIIDDGNKLNTFYESVDVLSQDAFFASWVKAAQALQGKRMNDVVGAVYPVYKPDVSYIVQSNRLVLTAPVLRPTLFLEDGPVSLNYGGLGAVIGREIMYGYDINGSGYDSLGQKQNWWSDSAKAHYLKLAKCVQQSAQAFASSVKTSSRGTVEALLLSDVVGLQVAVNAFGLAGGEHSRTLPQIPFTPVQLFFLAHCFRWCDPDDTKNDKLPNKDRCNVPAMNTVQYGDAFNCTHADRMNPTQKCIFF